MARFYNHPEGISYEIWCLDGEDLHRELAFMEHMDDPYPCSSERRDYAQERLNVRRVHFPEETFVLVICREGERQVLTHPDNVG